jgi:serine phosphatase RsbU (regulator of sigma subunit)
MNSGGLILVIGSLLSATLAFVWVAWRIGGGSHTKAKDKKSQLPPGLEQSADKDVEHIFNDEFREELRNRGRLHFEKIIGENAMFLQQDLRQTTSQLNDYMRSEITRTLQEEFKKYEQSIVDAKQLAIDSIEKTITTIEQQRQLLEQQLETQSQAQKDLILGAFEKEMGGIINHYVLRAIGNQIDLSDQLDYILAELEANKAAIIEDVRRGA